MWTTLRSVTLAAILAPAVLFMPPWPEKADGAERIVAPVQVSSPVQATSCERAAWPYNATCADQAANGAPQLRLISTDRVIVAGR